MYDILIALAFIAMLVIPAILASFPRKNSDGDN